MRYRFGFVSNSSTSSFVSICRNDSGKDMFIYDIVIEMSKDEECGIFDSSVICNYAQDLFDKGVDINDPEYREAAIKILSEWEDFANENFMVSIGEQFSIESSSGNDRWFRLENISKQNDNRKDKLLKSKNCKIKVSQIVSFDTSH